MTARVQFISRPDLAGGGYYVASEDGGSSARLAEAMNNSLRSGATSAPILDNRPPGLGYTASEISARTGTNMQFNNPANTYVDTPTPTVTQPAPTVTQPTVNGPFVSDPVLPSDPLLPVDEDSVGGTGNPDGSDIGIPPGEDPETPEEREAREVTDAAKTYAENLKGDIPAASKEAQNKLSVLQLELNNLLTANQDNPKVVEAVEAKKEEILQAQSEISNLGGILQTQMAQSQSDLMRNTLIDPASVLKKAEVTNIDPNATGTNIDPNTGQVPDIIAQGSKDAVVSPMQGPANITAAGIAAKTSVDQVGQALDKVTPQQGTISDKATITAATMDPSTTAVGDLNAAQGTANLMENPVQREIKEGELISGVADAAKAAVFTEQIEAATASPSDKATVQGQLTGLMKDFEGGATPAWAAGAMRAATAQMAARGLGASSMAGQAVIQAAMEAALPIASADAQTVAGFEMQNLSNRQARAMLAAQQRATFMGMEFDQAFQARVSNAAKVSDVANMNFTAEQQIALENSRAINSMNMANLTNNQAMVMAKASAISQLETQNLTNQQQAAVQNAQNFLSMDMANLTNRQSVEMFKAQSMQQAILTDVAAENAAKQFNATSENQTAQFLANLNSQIAQFNSSQANAISQFNAGQTNANREFVAKLQEQRNQFNATNSLAIAQANAVWRQNTSTLNAAADNEANMEFAKTTNGLTAKSIDEVWQRERDIMDMFFNSEESAKDRILSLTVADKEADAAAMQLEYAEERDKTTTLMKLFWPF